MLAALNVLDFSSYLPGPYATLWLADLGANVIRVENPNAADMIRQLQPKINHSSSFHATLNRSKRSLALDLKHEKSKAVIEQLIQTYDVIVESFRPGVMQRLGLDYHELKKINPKIIYCSITGYGQTGPYAEKAGHDINFMALSGHMSYSGTRENGPANIALQVADLSAGAEPAAIAILSAIIYRHNTGKGQYIDISMTDCMMSLHTRVGAEYLSHQKVASYESDILSGASYYGVYQTKDGRYISVASIEKKFWHKLCDVLGCIELKDKMFSDNQEEQKLIRAELANIFLTKTFNEWQSIFAKIDVCVEPLLNLQEAFDHPQIQSRQLIKEVKESDEVLVKQVAMPVKFSEYEPAYKHTGAKLGEHTKEILSECGFSKKCIEQLFDEKVIQ